jgi:DNA-binding transcriptional regulator YdaS (Cro superfamily)
MDHIDHIKKAMEICGGTQQALADKAGLTQPGVRWLLHGGGKVSPETAIRIEEATGGQVTRQQLCPHIFGAAA